MESCLQKQSLLWELFQTCTTPEAKYEKIIAMGRSLPPFPADLKNSSYLVPGCQSRTYLVGELQEGCLYFRADSDALISKGLAALLINIYSGEKPEASLLCPPTVLQKLQIFASLSPLRSNGLKAIYYKMQETAAHFS